MTVWVLKAIAHVYGLKSWIVGSSYIVLHVRIGPRCQKEVNPLLVTIIAF